MAHFTSLSGKLCSPNLRLSLMFDLTTEAAQGKKNPCSDVVTHYSIPLISCISMWPVRRRTLDHCGQFISIGTSEVINKEQTYYDPFSAEKISSQACSGKLY